MMRLARSFGIGIAILIGITGCGHRGFDHSTDDGLDATGTGVVLVAGWSVAHWVNPTTLQLPVTVAPGSNRLLIASVGIGSHCADPSQPSVVNVTYAGISLKRIDGILGTPCGANAARSEQWQLTSPPAGTDNVDVMLTTITQIETTIHVAAVMFTGVDQTMPVRGSITATGGSTTYASVAVPSAAGDLVVSTFGAGDFITAPGTGQDPVFIHNVSGGTSLDNSAASTTPGAPLVLMEWSLAAPDEWQIIASSLRPQ